MVGANDAFEVELEEALSSELGLSSALQEQNNQYKVNNYLSFFFNLQIKRANEFHFLIGRVEK
jgi:hypothetical protein